MMIERVRAAQGEGERELPCGEEMEVNAFSFAFKRCAASREWLISRGKVL